MHDYKGFDGDIWLTKFKSSYVKDMLVREFGCDIGFHVSQERMLYHIDSIVPGVDMKRTQTRMLCGELRIHSLPRYFV